MAKKAKLKIHSIKYNFIMNVILKTSAFLFPLITFPYVSRVLGATANGNISFASSVVSYFSLCASLGIPSYGIRKCAEVRDNRELLSKTVQELLIINIICTIISYIAFSILVFSIEKFAEQKLLFYVTSLSIIFNTLGIDWFYQGIEQYDYITIRNIAFKIIAVVLMFIFIHTPTDYVKYAGITVLGSVGSNVLNITRTSHYIDFKLYKSYNLTQHLKPIFLLFLYNATTTIFTNLDQVMLGFMSSSREVGYYAATVKIKNILTSVITALGSVMLPRVAYYLKQNNKEKFTLLIKESFDFILLSAIPIALYFVVESRPIILFLAGQGYERSVTIMQFIAPSIIFIGLSSVTAWQLLIPLKLEIYTVIGAVIAAIVNVVLNLILIPSIGGCGAAIATTIAELSVLLTHVVVLRDRIKSLIETREIVVTVFCSIISFFILVIFNQIVSARNYLLECMVTAGVYFGSYSMLLFACKETILVNFIKNFKKIR